MLPRSARYVPMIGAKAGPCASGRRQHQFRAQAAERRVAEHELAAIERRQIRDDRQAQPRARLVLVELAPAAWNLLARFRRQAGPVIVDQDVEESALGRAR